MEAVRLAPLKEAAKLCFYFLIVILLGAILSPPVFWAIQHVDARHFMPPLARYGFEKIFHRTLLVCALVFLWPLLRSLRLRSTADLRLRPNAHRWRDAVLGFFGAALPLALAAGALLFARVFVLKEQLPWAALAAVAGTALVVPVLEEFFFRGIFLGVLLRDLRPGLAAVLVAAFYAIVHFLKAPERTNEAVTWHSGFNSIANSFHQFADPLLLAGGFTTLFLVGCILAYARIRTHSLWLPIGLHSGWIFVSAGFGKLTRRVALILPWLGANLLVGLIPLAVGALTWLIITLYLRRTRDRLA